MAAPILQLINIYYVSSYYIRQVYSSILLDISTKAIVTFFFQYIIHRYLNKTKQNSTGSSSYYTYSQLNFFYSLKFLLIIRDILIFYNTHTAIYHKYLNKTKQNSIGNSSYYYTYSKLTFYISHNFLLVIRGILLFYNTHTAIYLICQQLYSKNHQSK